MRQVALDLETTGLDALQGHRIIEIGVVEILDRQLTDNEYHQLVNPERQVDMAAFQVHGYSTEDLQEQPVFAEVASDLLKFIAGAEVLIHNAAFDMGFLDVEFQQLAAVSGSDIRQEYNPWTVVDTLQLARELNPGQGVGLDALIRKYEIKGESRELHGALKDARYLAAVYLAMTSGQRQIDFQVSQGAGLARSKTKAIRSSLDSHRTPRIKASEPEMELHRAALRTLASRSGNKSKQLWPEAALAADKTTEKPEN